MNDEEIKAELDSAIASLKFALERAERCKITMDLRKREKDFTSKWKEMSKTSTQKKVLLQKQKDLRK